MKTLEDIKGKLISWDRDGASDKVVKVSSLRDEAIAWIQYWRRRDSKQRIHGKVMAFKDFFNITEEDLKRGSIKDTPLGVRFLLRMA